MSSPPCSSSSKVRSRTPPPSPSGPGSTASAISFSAGGNRYDEAHSNPGRSSSRTTSTPASRAQRRWSWRVLWRQPCTAAVLRRSGGANPSRAHKTTATWLRGISSVIGNTLESYIVEERWWLRSQLAIVSNAISTTQKRRGSAAACQRRRGARFLNARGRGCRRLNVKVGVGRRSSGDRFWIGENSPYIVTFWEASKSTPTFRIVQIDCQQGIYADVDGEGTHLMPRENGGKKKKNKIGDEFIAESSLSYFLEELTAAAISNFLSSATGCLWNSRASAAAAASWLWKPYNSTSTHLRHPLHVTPASSFLLILLLEFSPPDRKWGCLTSCKLSSDSSTYLFRVDSVKNRREEKEDGSCE